MGNRKIKKVTPSMEWSRKRWTTKGWLINIANNLTNLIESDILTPLEKTSIRAMVLRLNTINKEYRNRSPESKAEWLRKVRIAAYNKKKGYTNGS